jgi:predicted kinase
MLQVMRGLPGSGKSTHAKAWVDENPDARARVSRDDMRLMLHGGYRNKITEQQVTTACETVAVGLLRAGVDVVTDDTCLEPRHLRAWKDVALATRATIKVVDLRGVPLEVCLARNAARANPVPATWVIEQWERHVEPHSGIHH